MAIRESDGGLRIIVLGYVVRGPLGGMVWSDLQYLMGLADLGHDVYFLEDSDDYPSCYQPEKFITDADPSYGLSFATRVFREIGFGERWAYFDAHTATWHGPCSERVAELCSTADVVLNLAGVNPLRSWTMEVPIRVLVDQDPTFMQIRHLTEPARQELGSAHNRWVTFGANVGRPDCGVPDDGFAWKATRPPVYLGGIDVTPGPVDGLFTTVMQWESYPAREFAGERFGMKAESFESYKELPAHVGALFELALGGSSAPREQLRACGWLVRDPSDISRDPWTYESYIRSSKAEFGIAKHGYVISHSGWFSERSVAYVAMGRPVVVQDTGFSQWLTTEYGVLPFSTLEEAAESVRSVNRDYKKHAASAREIAHEYFDSGTVLSSLIDDIMTEPEPPRVSAIERHL
ncbi:MAG: hypothetical protein ACRDJI_00840 [Actinomycetota bacterium]